MIVKTDPKCNELKLNGFQVSIGVSRFIEKHRLN